MCRIMTMQKIILRKPNQGGGNGLVRVDLGRTSSMK